MQDRLSTVGFVGMFERFAAREDAWNAAGQIVEQASVEFPLAVLGDFVIAPLNGPPSRDFQTWSLWCPPTWRASPLCTSRPTLRRAARSHAWYQSVRW
jgi:hypothetical protein